MVKSNIYTDGAYLKNNEYWHTEDSFWKAREVFRMADRNSVRPSAVCEIGCGAGLILERLASEYRIAEKYFGYDISPDAAAFWRERSELVDFRNVDLLLEDVRYELILCLDVFEHVPDYMGFLTKLREKGDWFIFHIPLELHVSGIIRDTHRNSRAKVGHLHYFSAATAIEVLADCGFDVVDTGYTCVSLEEIQGKKRVFKTKVANALRKLVSSISSDAFSAKILGGYSLIVLARPARFDND